MSDTAERYAVYFVPPHDSALAAFGRSWLGYDIETGEPVEHSAFKGIAPTRLKALTSGPRPYGFHGTIKPPFELAPTVSLDGLLTATRICAASSTPADIPPLEVVTIGKFVALSPIKSSLKLEGLATNFVRALEGFRRHQTDKEMARYRQNKLTVHQEQMVDHWGYPFVLEEFRFHMTLSDRIDDEDERADVLAAAHAACEDLLGQSVPVKEVAVCMQPSARDAMRVIQRIPLGRNPS